jgi:hypothetical protein
MRTQGRGGLALAAAVLVGLLVSSAIVWRSSYATFSATSVNPGNAWAAGNLVLTDDDGGGAASGTAMFNASGLVPGSTGTKCITVTYNGNVSAPVKLYAASPTGTLAQYLDLTVEIGTGGSFADCTGFTPSGFIYSTTQPVASAGTLGDFNTTRTSYANGVGSWTPTGSAQSRTYRFIYTLQNNASAMNLSAGVIFTWEAQA